jgi:hypothetical protein
MMWLVLANANPQKKIDRYISSFHSTTPLSSGGSILLQKARKQQQQQQQQQS